MKFKPQRGENVGEYRKEVFWRRSRKDSFLGWIFWKYCFDIFYNEIPLICLKGNQYHKVLPEYKIHEWWTLHTFGRINFFKIGEPECSSSSLLILSSLSTSSMISSLMICKTFLNRPSVFFACQILSEMLKDVLQKRGGGWWPKENSRNSFLCQHETCVSLWQVSPD